MPVFPILLLVVLGILPRMAWAQPMEEVVLDLRQPDSATDGVQGFLHGFERIGYDREKLDWQRLQALRPRFWRMGMSDQAGKNYLLAKALNPAVKVTVVLSDQLAVLRGGYHALRPWEDWNKYESDVRQIVALYRQHGVQVDYWDVWSEPDTHAMWRGSCDQAMQMFERTARVIREVDATARVVGPSVSDVNEKGACSEGFLSHFLRYVTEHRLRWDGVSWHEFHHPRNVPLQAAAIRAHFQRYPSWGAIPEMHVNEFSGPRDAQNPAWAVAWLQSLETARVDWASRACWDDGCGAGLDGLFRADNRTPNALYWVHQAYAAIPSGRMRVRTSSPDTVVIAGRQEGGPQIAMLLARLGAKEGGAASGTPLRLRLQHVPSVRPHTVMLQRIVAGVSAPVTESQPQIGLRAGAWEIMLPDVREGEAWFVRLQPDEMTLK